MDFLDQVFFNNTIRSYLIVAVAIFVVLMLKRYLSRYLISLSYKLITRKVSKESFVNLVVDPLKWFLVVLVSVFAIDKLNFPGILLYTIYGHSTADIIARIGAGAIIVSFIWLALRVVDFIAVVLEEKARQTADSKDNQLVVFFRDFLKAIITIIGLLMIIKACFNQPLGHLLTGLSIVGAALALSARESLENLIASFIIFFDKPFFSGDTVKVNNITGTVEKIGLRSTRILTTDKTLVTVPNKQMVDSIVDNWSMRTQRRAEIRLDLSLNTHSSKVETVISGLQQILGNYAGQLAPFSVFLKDIGKSGITVIVEYFTAATPVAEFDSLKQAIAMQVKKLLEENGVEFAGEINRTVINSESREN